MIDYFFLATSLYYSFFSPFILFHFLHFRNHLSDARLDHWGKTAADGIWVEGMRILCEVSPII
jgi:hypothetical protein